MKNKVLFLLALCCYFGNAASSQSLPQGRTELRVQECNNLNKTIRDTSNTGLLHLVRSIEGSGFIKFDLEQVQAVGGISEKMNLLGVTSADSFAVVRVTTDPNDPEITYVSTQQYYNGILVEGGGYTQGFISCLTFLMNAYIMEDIGLDLETLTPSYTKQQTISILQNHETDNIDYISSNPENDMELVIDKDLTESCNYILSWKMKYRARGLAKMAYVNANSGEVYREISDSRSLNAPTADYGTISAQNFKDFFDSGKNVTELRSPDNSVRTFDKSNSNEAGIENTSNPFDNSLLPTTSATTIWSNTEHEPEVYQAHHVTTSARGVLKDFGLNFPTILFVAGHVDFDGAKFLTGNQTVVGLDIIEYGRKAGKSYALFDIAGHELTHAHMAGKLSTALEPSAIEEALCDIFGELTEKLITGNYDWTIGGDNGLDIRELDNPVISTYQGIKDNSDIYDASGPMGRWFVRIANSFGIVKASQIVLASIPLLNFSSGYSDMRSATITVTEQLHGECSWWVKEVAYAWHMIGVGDQYLDCIYISGNRNYCEEYLGTGGGNVHLLLENPLSGHTYRWTYPYDWTAIGQSAPQTYWGTHLRIYKYGTMNSFPKLYTVTLTEFDGSGAITREENITIRIKDCDNDDPKNPCLDAPSYLVVDGGNDEINPVTFEDKHEKVVELKEKSVQFSEAFKPEMDYSYSIYNISGQVVTEGRLNEFQGQLDLPQTGFYIIHIFSKEKKLVQTEKLVYIKN